MTNSPTPFATKFDLLLIGGGFDLTFAVFENKVEAYSGARHDRLAAAVKSLP
jgi:hypothetical protein